MATGFLIGIKPDGNAELQYQGTPYGMRQEFKRLTLEKGCGFIEIIGFDDFSGPQPRKRRRFRKNSIEAKSFEVREPETAPVKVAKKKVAKKAAKTSKKDK